MNDELNNSDAALDRLDKKTFVEALTNIPNVGIDADFQRINDENEYGETTAGTQAHGQVW
jgi:hypothetical protein